MTVVSDAYDRLLLEGHSRDSAIGAIARAYDLRPDDVEHALKSAERHRHREHTTRGAAQ